MTGTEPPALSAFPATPCSICDDRLAVCWRFRADDKHCPLCGVRVLRLRVSPATPDGAVWFYLHPTEPPRLRLTWERGLENRPTRKTFRPALDCARSGAYFTGDRVGSLEFALEELPDDRPDGDTLTVRLRPLFEGLEALPLPPAGVPGQIHLALSTGSEVRPALLLPPPQEITLTCTDPSIARRAGVWQIYQRGQGVRVPMRLTTAVPLWAGGLRVAADSDPDVTIEGFSDFALLEPHRPHAFALRVNSTHWAAQTSHGFKFFVDLATLGPMTLSGDVALLEGRKLLIGGPNPRLLEVQLGRAFAVSFTLTATTEGGADEEAITLTDYTVLQHGGIDAATEDEANWLRVLTPAWTDLPLPIRPRGADQPAEQLVLEVDTAHLDRQRYAGALLRGAVELLDSRKRRWRCEVHATVTRPPRLNGFVAVDWGTTNSCAAYCAGTLGNEPPHSLSFDEEQQRTPELFPSDIYFSDLSDPNHPVFFLGHEAARRARLHPECCLRSVKRKFQFLDRVFVMDEYQRGHTYPIARVVELLLERLVNLAEAAHGQEIHQLALTFPTKWSARVRHQLERVTQALAVRLQRDRQPFLVQVLPPQIDEANAVAINLITSHHGRTLPDTFYLIAYDFGGGTIDTSVLEVHLPDDPAGLRTRYVGIGGRHDFGGDDVTRAVLLLLHDRLTAALLRRTIVLDDQTQKSARVREIPLVADGEPLRDGGPGAADRYQLGRRNWDALWKIAELIKMDLCEAEADDAPASPPRPATAARLTGLADDFALSVEEDASFESAIADAFEQEQTRAVGAGASPVTERLRPRLAELHCLVTIQPGPAGSGVADLVWNLDTVLDPLEIDDRAAFFEELHFTLDHACEFPLADPHGVGHGQRYNVRQRVEDTVRELHWQCGQQRVQPHIAVLAGGGSRLPLVGRLLRQYFPSPADLLYYQKDFAKRRVAHGMASYLALRQVVNLDHQLARSVDVLHRPLGLQKILRVDGTLRSVFEAVVPLGARLNDPTVWHPFVVGASQLRDADGNPRLTLFVQDWRGGPQEFGACDLARPTPAADTGLTAAPLPFVAGATYQGGLRLCGAQRVEVRLALEDATYGPFAVTATATDPEAALQS